MTKIKLCGLRREVDIQIANELKADYIGFVFAKKSIRYIDPEEADHLKKMLQPGIQAVGVFVNEKPEIVAKYLEDNIIDLAQLHGSEDEAYMTKVRSYSKKPLIKAFSVKTEEDIQKANASGADYVLMDSGSGGTGTVFDWSLLEKMERPYFLAGGLDVDNVQHALGLLHPFAVDVSSGIESNGYKDGDKMRQFVKKVRGEE